jgi:hypothetical protein
MLTFDPVSRITVPDALEHPWLASYHDIADEPECPTKFEGWRKIEELETLEQFREALWSEIEDFRKEVRGMSVDLKALPVYTSNVSGSPTRAKGGEPGIVDHPPAVEHPGDSAETEPVAEGTVIVERVEDGAVVAAQFNDHSRRSLVQADPVVAYARRSSIMQPSRQGSAYNSPTVPSQQHLPAFIESAMATESGTPQAGIAFPNQGYVVPARSRTASMAGGEVTRRLLRTLSTVSIHESAEGLAGGLADIAPIGKFIVDRQTTGADAPASEMPRDFGIEETSEGEESNGCGDDDKEKKEGRFRIA